MLTGCEGDTATNEENEQSLLLKRKVELLLEAFTESGDLRKHLKKQKVTQKELQRLL
jgi:hypothetical protein